MGSELDVSSISSPANEKLKDDMLKDVDPDDLLFTMEISFARREGIGVMWSVRFHFSRR